MHGLSTIWGKDINNYIPREFTVGVAKTVYTAKVSSFSDDLLKGIRLSPRFEGSLLPAKFMWEAGTKKDDSGENEEEEKDNGNNTGTNSNKSPSDEEDDKKDETKKEEKAERGVQR